MTSTSKYQLVTFGDRHQAIALIAIVKRHLVELGLSADSELDVFIDPAPNAVDVSRAPTAVAFFGARVRLAGVDDAISKLKDSGTYILPIVPNLNDYRQYVPDSLAMINGIDASGPKITLETAAQLVLEELHLIRQKRLVFVSYRRDEATKVATQLYRHFDDRGCDVFLDTHSVRGGAEFQSVLWDRMADSDLLVLLDSPRALSSRWVAAELARAEALGLAVLQLIWPEHARFEGTDFCEPIYLSADDFESTSPTGGLDVELSAGAIERVVATAEGMRARALAARRNRITGELWARTQAAGLDANIQPARFIDVVDRAGGVRRVFPVVGHPDSIEVHRSCDSCDGVVASGVILYDALGVIQRRRTHLGWLNGFLPIPVLATDELTQWISEL